ncbi:hypothetical protein GCK32_019370 [Trichostrongylus colubriformis]|uniref:Uncharacterized protein n=1 Tax=Trichostrongylus colubriformis TaxID=6319 RepID=A0AAN8IBS8_TRICO
MSPPCQPFTKKGSQQGIDDHRCDSFMALMKKLKQMRKRPRYIFLENVLGFETSSVHKELISTLTELHYGYQREIERLPNNEWAVYNTLIPCIIAADPSTLSVILFMTILRGTDEAKARVQGIKCHNEKVTLELF